MKNTILILAATLIAIYSCKPDYPLEVIEVLQQAGENRQELEEVFEYYKQNDSDSLKLEAAYFLIQNMPYHFTTTSSRLDSFDSEFFGVYLQ